MTQVEILQDEDSNREVKPKGGKLRKGRVLRISPGRKQIP